ncbi:MAG TPA: hypothetical protein VHJ20_23890 [Polyangia bacterium]|nr:hypothetical protein [Polyangia bacterium]
MANKRQRKPEPKRKKKTWESPRVKSGRLFEANSLACGKSDPDTDQCSSLGGAMS